MFDVVPFRNKIEEHEFARIITHIDADGICSASIIAKLILNLGKKFHVSFVKQLTPEFIRELLLEPYKFYIFTDLGSGYLQEIKPLLEKADVVIIDHHQIKENFEHKRLTHYNPYLVGVDGSRDMCASTLAAIIAKKLGLHLEHLALIGSIGDNQEEGKYNQQLIEESDRITVSLGLKFFGRISKPIHEAISQSLEPYVPGISGNPSSTFQLLQELGIQPKDGNRFRTIADLSLEEQRKIADALIVRRASVGKPDEIFGKVYSIKDWFIEDAREFATLLNSTGRLEKPSIGFLICMGSEDAMKMANEMIRVYRQRLMHALSWAEMNGERIDGFFVINAGDEIPDTLIGTVCSILLRSKLAHTIIGLANSDNAVKVSIRTKLDVNLGKIMHELSEEGFEGGGHKKAAGARIKRGREEEFIKKVIEYIRRWKDGGSQEELDTDSRS